MAEETRNVCQRENGRLYIFCYTDDDWKEQEVCKKLCSEGRRNRCVSWRLHIEGKPIAHRRKKREVKKERELHV